MIDEQEYRRYASHRFRSQQGSPYGFAFQLLMVTILAELVGQRKQNQPIDVLIEDGHPGVKQALALIV